MLPGDLVISEIMVDPTGDDEGAEWVEVYNASGRDLVLDRMVLEAAGPSGQFKTATVRHGGHLAPGHYFVFGNTKGPGGLIDYGYDNLDGRAAFAMANSRGSVRISCQTTLIDAIRYGEGGALPKPQEGVSLCFNGGIAPDGLLNNQALYWCHGGTLFYDSLNRGTPGTKNEICSAVTCNQGGVPRNVVPPGPGDLMITEVLADPANSDDGKEWLELLVTADGAVDLNGLRIESQKAGSQRVGVATLGSTACLSADPGSYVVLGSKADRALNGGVDIHMVVDEWVKAGGFFPNSEQLEITLWRGCELVDLARVPSVAEGHSASLDGALREAVDNDAAAAFCAAWGEGATQHFDGLGTPGRENGLCGRLFCRDDVGVRPILPAAPGELVVNEIFADSDREWVELFVAGAAPVDLNGLAIVSRSEASDLQRTAQLLVERCVRALPGALMVVATGGGAGGVVADAVVGRLDLLTSSRASLGVLANGAVIDEAAPPMPIPGHSLSLAPGKRNALGNDDAAAFCVSTTRGLFDGLGTPGKDNLCGPSCVVSGEPRPAAPIEAGGLLITEVLSNPVDDDTHKEWLEILVRASEPVDLNGLVIKSRRVGSDTSRTASVEAVACLGVAPGQLVVLGASADGAMNGDVEVDVVVPGLERSGGFFANSGALEVSLWQGAALIDMAVLPQVPEGSSASLDGALGGMADNDEPVSFCEAWGESARGHFEGRGTPGAPNGLCGLLFCRDADEIRPVAGPSAGELVLNEAFHDTGREWVELFVSAPEPVDLNGLRLLNRSSTSSYSREALVRSERCETVQPGAFVVLGSCLDAGGVVPDLVVEGLDLISSVETTVEISWNSRMIDLAGLPTAVAGHSLSLEPSKRNAADNDDPSAFCASTTQGLFLGAGTPGMDNLCGPSCLAHGVPRPAVLPAAEELVISEVFANPTGSDNCNDWIEIYARPAYPVFLNGLSLVNRSTGRAKVWTVQSSECLELNAGDYALVGGHQAFTTDDGIVLAGELSCSGSSRSLLLASGTPTLELCLVGEVDQDPESPSFNRCPAAQVVDAVAYRASRAGRSFSLDPAALSAQDNDDEYAWCVATSTQGGFVGGLGSPGVENEQCPGEEGDW